MASTFPGIKKSYDVAEGKYSLQVITCVNLAGSPSGQERFYVTLQGRKESPTFLIIIC
jgi:hypothetical protein